MADVQELVTDLQIKDNLTGVLANAKAAVTGFGDASAATTAKVSAGFAATEASAAKASAAFTGLGTSVISSVKALVGLGAAFKAVEFFGDAIKSAQDDEASVARLTAALHANVEAWDGNTQAIEGAIAAGAKLGFSDDEIRSSITRLSAATHDVGQSLQLQNVAMDLARFKGVDLATATDALVTVEAGRFRGLAQLGIVLKAGATQTEALAAVEKIAAGSAEAFGKTSAGAAEEAGIAMSEAAESIGKGLLPAVTTLSHFAKDDLAPALTVVADNMDKILPVAEGLALVFGTKLAIGLARSTLALAEGTAALILNSGAATIARELAAGLVIEENAEAVSANAAAAAEERLALARGGGGVRALVGAIGEVAIPVAAAVGGFIAFEDQIHKTSEEAATAGMALKEYDHQVAILRSNLDSGAIGQAQYNDAVAKLDAAVGPAVVSIHDYGAAIAAGTDFTGKFNIAAFTAKENVDGLAKSLDTGLLPTLEPVKTGMLGAGAGTDTLSDALLRAANNALIAKAALDVFNTAATRNVIAEFPKRLLGVDPKDTTSNARLDTQNQETIDKRDAAEAAAAKAAADRLAAAKQGVTDYAATVNDKLNTALSREKDLVTTLFDRLHERHLQAIADTEKLAEKQHSTALQAISDALKLKLEANAAPVTAAEQAQQRLELQRQRRDLGAALQNAQQSGDPLAVRNAAEALQSFNAAQRINSLKETQAKLDFAANAQARADTQAADDLLNAAKLQQARDLNTENARNKKQRDDFDRALAALKIRDAGASPAKIKADTTALEEKFGITTDVRGFHHIADVIATAIHTIKIPAPEVQLTVNVNVPAQTLNGRLIAAALASSQSFSATPGVRTGSLTPKP